MTYRRDGFIGPYEAEAVRLGRRLVDALIAACESDDTLSATDVLAGLSAGEATRVLVEKALAPVPEPCPRAIDVHGLFSTEPDVFGGFTDVSPFVRSRDEDADVTVFWRDWRSEAELRRSEALIGPAFARDEGCAVAAGRLRGFLEKRRAWSWDDKREAWGSVRAGDVRPGMLLMLRREDGGYSRELGWTGSRIDKLDDAPLPGEPHERFADDRYSESGAWVTLTDHLRDAGREAAHVVQALNLDADLGSAVIRASSEHDIGKALLQWQGALPKPPPRGGGVWAKAPYQFAILGDVSTAASEAEAVLRASGVRHGRAESQEPDAVSGDAKFTWHTESKVSGTVLERIRALAGVVRAWNVPFRPGLRHEAATALALWHSYYRSENSGLAALSIYLCAAHHGKVRTVLTSRSDGGEDVCGVPKTTAALPWKERPLDFACAVDGAAGRFSEDGSEFTFEAPGWTGLVADPPNRTKTVKGRRVTISGEKTYRPTLARDNLRVVGTVGTNADDTGALWWVMDGEAWSEGLLDWLDASLARMTYFGRAEAITKIQRVEKLPADVHVNCTLEQRPSIRLGPGTRAHSRSDAGAGAGGYGRSVGGELDRPAGSVLAPRQAPRQAADQAAAFCAAYAGVAARHSVRHRYPSQPAAESCRCPYATLPGKSDP